MPRWLIRIRLRLRSLLRGAQVEQELHDELAFHLEREAEERRAAGLTPEDAWSGARRSMGPIARNMEECRDMRRLSFVEHRMQDLRFALRQLRKHPAFATTAIGVLALGIATNVAIFGFVDATLIRSLPYADQSRLVLVYGTHARKPGRDQFSYLDYIDVQRSQPRVRLSRRVRRPRGPHTDDARGSGARDGPDGDERILPHAWRGPGARP